MAVCVFVVIISAIYVLFLLCTPLYFSFGFFKILYHDALEWHIPDNSNCHFDGLSVHSTCKYCHKDIMQDSQGNWF